MTRDELESVYIIAENYFGTETADILKEQIKQSGLLEDKSCDSMTKWEVLKYLYEWKYELKGAVRETILIKAIIKQINEQWQEKA